VFSVSGTIITTGQVRLCLKGKRETNMQEKRLGGGKGDPGTHRGQGLVGERCAAWPAVCTRLLRTPSGPNALVVSSHTRRCTCPPDGQARALRLRAETAGGAHTRGRRPTTRCGLQTGSSPWHNSLTTCPLRSNAPFQSRPRFTALARAASVPPGLPTRGGTAAPPARAATAFGPTPPLPHGVSQAEGRLRGNF
jgi:hypothetical protein